MAVSAEKSAYPELDRLARTIASDIEKRINREAPAIESAMPYKAQYVLEELIRILEEAV